MSHKGSGEAGSGKHTPQKGEPPRKPAAGGKHSDTGEHEKEKPLHRDTVTDVKGTGKYPE